MDYPSTVHDPIMGGQSTAYGLPMGRPWMMPMGILHGEFMNCRRTSVHGLAMDPPWTVHGPTGEEPVTVHGRTMDNPWTVQGQFMDPPWTNYGPTMDPYGGTMDHHGPIRAPWTVHGLSMDHHGAPMDCLWNVWTHGPTMNPPWTNMRRLWTVHGNTMDCPWTHHGGTNDYHGPTVHRHGLSMDCP